ncbi:MAG: LCP family protein [Actinomycetia bacterium]|nr:LCP family protein [Actinomycetes bacterium]
MRKLWKKPLRYAVIFLSVVLVVGMLTPVTLNAGTSEQVQAFVSRFYVNCLGRQPDRAGLNEWVNRLMTGTKTGEDVAKGFVLSQEFISQNHSDSEFVTILYRAFFNRQPDSYGMNAWLGRMKTGQTRAQVLDGFLRSDEFAQLCSSYGINPFAGSTSAPALTSSLGTGTGFTGGNKVNFIIWGDDSASDRPGGRVSGRTDINIFVHLNLDTKKAVVVTIPRDTWTAIPGYSNQKINAAHAIGGNDLAVRTFERFTGIPIDFYMVTDFDGFKPLIDYFGGVATTVEENIADSFSGCYLTPGTHTINGTQALALARARHGRSLYGGGAYAREKQSAMLLTDLLMQKRSMVNASNLASFLNTMRQYVWTNISVNQAAKILPTLLSIRRENINITTFNSWPQYFGKASAVGYNEAEKNQFFQWVANQ